MGWYEITIRLQGVSKSVGMCITLAFAQFVLAGVLGIEPRFPRSELGVLPLDDSPMWSHMDLHHGLPGFNRMLLLLSYGTVGRLVVTCIPA